LISQIGTAIELSRDIASIILITVLLVSTPLWVRFEFGGGSQLMLCWWLSRWL
jgi:hypothetical protein